MHGPSVREGRQPNAGAFCPEMAKAVARDVGELAKSDGYGDPYLQE